MREWGLSVRAYIGDLGEIYTPSVPDMVDVYLYGPSDERLEAAKDSRFFRMALPIAGPSHLLDWVLYMTVVRLMIP